MKNSQSSDRDILLSIFSDVFKDVNGFRPTGILFPSDLSDDEIQAELDTLQAKLDSQLAEEDDLPSDAFEDWRDEIFAGDDSELYGDPDCW